MRTERSPRLQSLAWLPIPLFLIVLAVLSAADVPVRFEPPYLLPALNFVFLTLVSLIVACLAAKSYMAGGTQAAMILGCGMWTLGIACAISGVFGYFDMDAQVVTVHNCGSFLAGLLISISAVLSTARSAGNPSGGPAWRLPTIYLGALGGMILVTIGAWGGYLPTFFIPGTGATPVRQAVVIMAVLEFAASSILFAALYRRSGEQFLRWYALGLGLIALGLLGVIPQTQLGSPINWAARLAQYLGGVYILAAVIAVFRQYHRWGIPLGKALNELEGRHRSLVELCPDAILVQSQNKYVYANPAAARLFGAGSPEEVIGRDALELVAPAFRDLARRRIEQAYAGAVPPLRETRFIRFDGRVIDVETTGARVEFGGKPAIQIVVRDITERKRIEEALRRSEQLYRAIGESINYGVWVCAPDGRNIYASESFLKMVGLTQEQCSNFGWGEVLHPDDADRTIAAWKKCVQTGGTWDIEHRFRGADGQWHDVLARGVPVYDAQGEITSWAGINLDISRLKQAEEALRRANDDLDLRVQERTEQLSRMIDALHSEVAQRTIAEQTLRERSEQLHLLASELTLAEQRERQRLAQVLHDGLQQILVGAKFRLALLQRAHGREVLQESAEVAALIDDAIETSRSLTAEISPPILYELGLLPALEWLARWMRERHALTLDLNLPSQINPIAEDAKVLLFHATRELLFNVIKHAKVDKACLQVSQVDHLVLITVADAGAGFDPAQLRSAGGSARGFGLFSVRERVHLLGGHMVINSTPGQGSSITLAMPVSAS
jgi:PAS domain S-box-containing protein